MQRLTLALAAVLLSAALQTLIFPVGGPLPFARAQMAWVALVPWLWLVFTLAGSSQRPGLRATLWSYLCGVLWYAGHCYWIFQTMHQYGGLSSFMAAVVLLLFCLYLGLYHALYGAVAAMLWRAFRGRCHPMLFSLLLAAAWVAVELARARLTSFPWNLLGYSQVDNAALTLAAPLTGIYTISFLLAWVNASFALLLQQHLPTLSLANKSSQLAIPHTLPAAALAAAVSACSIVAGLIYHAPEPASTARAVALQPNLTPTADSAGPPGSLEQQLAAESTEVLKRASDPRPGLILWPEAPAPYELHEQPLQSVLTTLAASNHATVIADSNAVDPDNTRQRRYRIYNAAGLFTANGLHARYNKIHLVPFGEFVPYANLFSFASGLTEQVGTFDRGTRRAPLSDGLHRYGVFICYESIFPEEVRQLALHGADVLVNLSDDGWYGDTSAPFQHSSMARMRAMENRRWLLRDTNTGITESIDPYGNIRAVAPRHQRLATVLPFAYSDQQTFYQRHGDVFAWICTAFTLAALLYAVVSNSTHIRTHC